MMFTPLPQQNFLSGLSSYIDPRRQMLLGLASGLVSGRNLQEGLGQGLQMAAMGRQQDDAYATAKKAEAERQAQLNQTVQYLQQNAPDLAGMVEAGMPVSEAWGALMKRQQGGGSDLTANMRDFMFAQENPDYASFLNPPKAPALPSGYRMAADGSALEFIPGGPADPAARQPPAMNSTIQKELFEADESIQAGQSVMQALDRAKELNMQSGEGPLADIFSQGGALFGDAQSVNTQELKNLVTAQALEQLKAVFGSMPTEGERKILLEIQGSVNQSRAVRERIYDRARQAVERRVVFNADKARALRSGKYFDEGFTPIYGGTAPAGEAPAVDDILTRYGL